VVCLVPERIITWIQNLCYTSSSSSSLLFLSFSTSSPTTPASSTSLLSPPPSLYTMSRPSSRPGSPGLGSSPRGSVVNLQQYAADAKISSHRGEEVQTGLINGEQKAQAAPTSAGEFGSQCVSMVLWLGSSGGSCRVVFFRWDRTESVPAGETRLEGEQIDTNGGESCVRTIELGKTHRLVSVRAHLASSSSFFEL
jgi:hypothetical protein